jgi:hypothetical protein
VKGDCGTGRETPDQSCACFGRGAIGVCHLAK